MPVKGALMILSARFTLRALLAGLLAPCLCYAGSHPVRVDASSNCLECHADHAIGDHVHPAIKRGCASCHSVENREDGSYVVLKQTKSIVCFECHQPAALQYTHLPYSLWDVCAVSQSAHFGESSPAAGEGERPLSEVPPAHGRKCSVAVPADHRAQRQQHHGSPL